MAKLCYFVRISHRGSAGIPAHVGGIPCQLQREDHLHGRAMVVVNEPEPVHRHIWSPWLWAVLGSSWFYRAWSQQEANQNVTLLELYLTVLAVHIWSNRLANERIILHSDNQALAPIINQQSSKDTAIMCPVRKLVITCLRFSIVFQVQHIACQRTGIPSVTFTSQRLPAKAPSASRQPEAVPPLPHLLV